MKVNTTVLKNQMMFHNSIIKKQIKMKKIILTSVIASLLSAIGLNAHEVTIILEPAAEVFIDGESQGIQQQVAIKLTRKKPAVWIKAVKHGYKTVDRRFSRQYVKPYKKQYIKLMVDEAFNESVESVFANKAINIQTTQSFDDAWRYIAMIARKHFDIMKVSDKDTGYMQSDWVEDEIGHEYYRFRMTVAQMSIRPLIFQIEVETQKLISGDEHQGCTVYKPWNRIFTDHEDMIKEMQLRLEEK